MFFLLAREEFLFFALPCREILLFGEIVQKPLQVGLFFVPKKYFLDFFEARSKKRAQAKNITPAIITTPFVLSFTLGEDFFFFLAVFFFALISMYQN